MPNPESIARRILGLDDVIGFVEKAQKTFDEKKAKKIQDKMLKNEFDLNDFRGQIDQMNSMGGINEMIKLMPKMKNRMNLNFDKKKIIWNI